MLRPIDASQPLVSSCRKVLRITGDTNILDLYGQMSVLRGGSPAVDWSGLRVYLCGNCGVCGTHAPAEPSPRLMRRERADAVKVTRDVAEFC